MRNTPLLIFIVLLLTSCSQQKETKYSIGQKSVTFVDQSRDRPLPAEIWYPTLDTLIHKEPKENPKELFKNIETVANATIPDEKFPLLVVSHGTGGNRFSLTWFIAEMVKEGYVVVSLDHYGNSTFNKIPREFIKWWERAIDVQYVLTEVLKDTEMGTKIDTTRIGGVGFSLGGYTNIALAGGYVDRTVTEDEKPEERELPAEFPDTDEIIDYENDSLIVSSYNQYRNLVKDDRIKAFFVMAPAIGFGFHSKEQTHKITAPIFIVAGKGDSVAPVGTNAKKYNELISTSKMYLFDENVGHYVFLNESTALGKEIVPEIAADHPSVNRKNIHDKTLQLALDFFNSSL